MDWLVDSIANGGGASEDRHEMARNGILVRRVIETIHQTHFKLNRKRYLTNYVYLGPFELE